MKYLVASDSHGSSKFIKQLLKVIDKEKPDKVIFLGDYLYNGARNKVPAKYDTILSTKLLNSIKDKVLFAIRGNCDSLVDETVLSYKLTDLEELNINERRFVFTHGDRYDEKNVPLGQGDVLISGHTHIPSIRIYQAAYLVNPGSVSIPKGGSKNSYLVIQDDEIFIKDLIKGKTII